MKRVTVINETNATPPRVAFDQIKNESLGDEYALNVIFTTSSRIKHLNTIYRDKTKATDILSFPISDDEGEIYICLDEVRNEAKKFDRTYENFLSFLFIHGCTHLKGFDHGATMESEEMKLRERFNI
ncbi:MAG: rRNA maturation RNase YbeY [Candidatus Paceibacterota bacterium]